MSFMLGNLSVSEIESRIGFNFPEEIQKYMNENKQHEAAKITKGKWHCFDLPFHLVCGDIETATKIYNSVKDRSGEVKEQLQISIQVKPQ